jgi:hypothetical protein
VVYFIKDILDNCDFDDTLDPPRIAVTGFSLFLILYSNFQSLLSKVPKHFSFGKIEQ